LPPDANILTRRLRCHSLQRREASKVISMTRLIGFSVLLCMAALSGGCATCCAPFDYNYLSQSGRWVRYNPTSGRVGSVFDEAGGPADVPPAPSTLPTNTQAEPTPVQSEPTPAQQPRMAPTNPSYPLPAPSRMSPTGPQTRTVIPRNMGETYLPKGL
jgi:hypothetical protein